MTEQEVEEYKRKIRRKNLLIFPLVILVRAPIMIVALTLLYIGEKLGELGDIMPGLERL